MTDIETPRIALVTGANRGLGHNTAVHLARAGFDVVGTSRAGSAPELLADVAAAGRRAAVLPLDTLRVDSFADFVTALRDVLRADWDRDTVDVLVNNAGTGVAAPFAETTEEQFDEMFGVHVKGVFFLTQALLPVLADGGSIVNISSGLARFVGPGLSAYASAKGAVEVLTRYLAQELGPRGITVNTVAPGATATDFAGGYLRNDEQARQGIAATVALGRVGRPDDIGGAIAMLVSGRSHWMTAQRVEVSGGQRL